MPGCPQELPCDVAKRIETGGGVAEAVARDFQAGRGLLAFVFIQIEAALRPADGLLVKTAGGAPAGYALPIQ